MILNYGSLNLDETFAVPHMVRPGETLSSAGMERHCGGKGMNQSIALARAGAVVAHAGSIGEDGGMLTSLLRQSGVDISRIRAADCPTGRAIIQVEDSGQNAILLYPGANAAALDPMQALEGCGAGDWLLVQNETAGTGDVFREAVRRNMKVAVNPSPFDERAAALPLEQAACLLVNEGESTALAGLPVPEGARTAEDYLPLLRDLCRRFPRTAVVLTLGGLGAWYGDAAGERYQPAFSVRAVDTTGAGDTFTGYFLAALTRGESPADAMRWGAAAAALAVTRPGAGEAVPLRDEVERFLSGENHS